MKYVKRTILIKIGIDRQVGAGGPAVQAIQDYLGRIPLPLLIAAIGGVKDHALVSQKPAQHRALSTPQIRQLIIIFAAKGCLTVPDKINHTHLNPRFTP